MADKIAARTVACPKCQGRVSVTDKGFMAAQSPRPIKWVVIRASCENRCELVVDDIPRRPV